MLTVTPATVRVFRLHSSAVHGADPRWVTASGMMDAESIAVPVSGDGPYRVRLFFSDPDDTRGQRVMKVTLQGKEVLKGLDVVKEAGGPRRSLVREFEVVAADGMIEIGLAAEGTLSTLINGVAVAPK